MIKTDQKQQELLEKFFNEETTWCPEHAGYHLIAAIFISTSMILCVMPYQVWDFQEDISSYSIGIMFYMVGVTYYMQKFNNYKEGRKMKMTYDVLKYLPVSHIQFYIYRMKKILKLCAWLTAVTVCCQTVFAIAFMHTFSAGNILLPAAVNFGLPMLFTGIGRFGCRKSW